MRSLIVLAAALLGLAGAAQAEDLVAEPLPTGIHVEYTDNGPVYADPAGKTLYTWSGDVQPGKSLCNDDHYHRIDGQGQVKFTLPEADKRPTCQQVWPAARATGEPVGKWTTLVRQDGSRQWVYGGKPLYTTVLDKAPGDVNGADYSVFAARAPLAAPTFVPPGVSIAHTTAGRTLVSADGWTLYTYDRDTARKSMCEGACAQTRVPLIAPELAAARGDWTTVERGDGAKQWAFRGKPLYTYAQDERRRDLSGAAAPAWKAAVIQPAPRPPTVITVNTTSAGDVFADSHGMTLYTFSCVEEAPDALGCDKPGASQLYRLTICGGPDRCNESWKPVAASAASRSPNRTWTIVQVDPVTGARVDSGGLSVWAYNGSPVYTFAGDHQPGDYNGHQYRVFPTRGFNMMLTSNDR
jgi:predicted lipoprotein with Yx(FWY)xxD motif